MEITYVNQKEMYLRARRRGTHEELESVQVVLVSQASPLRSFFFERARRLGIAAAASNEPDNPSGVYICKSIGNDLRHGNYMYKHLLLHPMSPRMALSASSARARLLDSRGVYRCKSVVNDLRHGNYI
jgi:hypothetical protein